MPPSFLFQTCNNGTLFIEGNDFHWKNEKGQTSIRKLAFEVQDAGVISDTVFFYLSNKGTWGYWCLNKERFGFFVTNEYLHPAPLATQIALSDTSIAILSETQVYFRERKYEKWQKMTYQVEIKRIAWITGFFRPLLVIHLQTDELQVWDLADQEQVFYCPEVRWFHCGYHLQIDEETNRKNKLNLILQQKNTCTLDVISCKTWQRFSQPFLPMERVLIDRKKDIMLCCVASQIIVYKKNKTCGGLQCRAIFHLGWLKGPMDKWWIHLTSDGFYCRGDSNQVHFFKFQ